jgi:predicted acyl esterase
MYKAGWGKKDDNQKRILAIDISREGFEWALEHSLMSNHTSKYTKEEWLKLKETTPVRIQWDPERDLFLEPLKYRTIQIGLSNEAVPLYVNEWIQNITEVTDLALQIHSLIQDNKIEKAKLLLPKEIPYIPSEKIQEKIEISTI